MEGGGSEGLLPPSAFRPPENLRAWSPASGCGLHDAGFDYSALQHHELDLTVFNISIRQTIAGHLLYFVPVLTEVSRRLLLRRKFRPHAARLARVTVRDLKEYRLLPFADFPWGWRAHRLLL
jgi:hypothetical protein